VLSATLKLAGRATMPYPLAKNLAGKTAGVVQFSAPNDLGHYVVFNQGGARDQYTCFLSSVGTASGASIRSATVAKSRCP
jgi:hypothetical protein